MSNKDKKVIVRSYARNAEKTLARMVDSIYAQTHENWELHLVDNASTDNTLALMREYADKDARVRALANSGNYKWKKGNRFTDYYKEYDLENTFMCRVDADDAYKPDFMEDMLTFAQEYELDIACSGFDYVDEVTLKTIEVRKPEEIMIIEGNKFDTDFANYHFYARHVCMKLFRLTVTGKISVTKDVDMLYGGDTAETLEYFRNAERIGIYPKAHYIYYANISSITYNWYMQRAQDMKTLHKRTVDYLTDKAGYVSERNQRFLCLVYYNAVNDAVNIIINDKKLTAAERLISLHNVFVNEYTPELLKQISGQGNTISKQALLNIVINWVDMNIDALNDRRLLNKAVELMAVIEKLQ